MRDIRTSRKQYGIMKYLTAFILIICIAGICCFIHIEKIIPWPGSLLQDTIDCQTGSFDDDQRSTMWPLFSTLMITMLGSIITTYVFLKGALDRMVDEKNYYHKVVESYRSKFLKLFFYYFIVCIMFLFAVAALYNIYYFRKQRTAEWIRLIIGITCITCIIAAGYFLYRCIYVEKGIYEEAGKLKKKTDKWLSVQLREDAQENAAGISRLFAGSRSGRGVAEEFQIDGIYVGDWEVFIDQFTNWEKFLLLMIDDKGSKKQAGEKAGIREAVTNGKEADALKDVEEKDAGAHGWKAPTYQRLQRELALLNMDKDGFLEIYEKLSEYRDYLRVRRETSGNTETGSAQREDDTVEKGLTIVFAAFVRQLSLKYLKSIPKIDLFCPSGRFVYADFYNARVENSSFRFSLFQYTVFARTRMINTNLGFSRFEETEFYSADIRDCSWNNCLFKECSLKESLWSNADLTGSNFEGGIIQNAVFENTVLSNMEFVNLRLNEVVFRNSRLDKVVFQNINDRCMQRCNFADSDLRDIQFCEELVPRAVFGIDFPEKKWFSRLDSWFYTDGCLPKDFIKDIPKQGTNYFRNLRVQRKPEGKKVYEKWSVWDRLKKMCFYNMEGSVFTNAVMTGICFYRMNFEQSDFRNAQMDESRLAVVNMSGCVMKNAGLREACIRGCFLGSVVLSDAILYHMDCWLTNFQDSDLTDVHASRSIISCCTFERSDCSRIDLTRTRVKYASFCDSILNEAELTNSDFEDVILDNCIAREMLSSYTEFKSCSFTNALLKYSSFNYTIFRNCSFRLANFSDSTVLGAEFRSCDFMDADFKGTTFIQTVFEDSENISEDIFERCIFIDVDFRGGDRKWKTLFLEEGNEIKVHDSGG